jgi:hypothetical protein
MLAGHQRQQVPGDRPAIGKKRRRGPSAAASRLWGDRAVDPRSILRSIIVLNGAAALAITEAVHAGSRLGRAARDVTNVPPLSTWIIAAALPAPDHVAHKEIT